MIGDRGDRLLVAVIALQLLAATIVGVVLIHDSSHNGTTQLVSVGPGGSSTTGTTLGSGSGQAGGGGGASGTGGGSGSTGGSATGGGASRGSAGGSSSGSNGAGAAGTTGAAKVSKGAPIKVGAVVTETGAINFAASAQGSKAYIDMVNAHGGVNGHKIILDMRDDQLDAARGRSEAQQLLAEGVFTFGCWNAPLTEASIVPFLTQNKMPLVGNYGVGAEYHSEWSYAFQSHHYGYEMGRFLGEQAGVTHPGVIFIGNSSSSVNDAQKRAFTAGLAAAGKTLQSKDIKVVDVTKASYDDVVTQLRLDKVNGIATLIDQTAYNRLQQSMDRQSWHPVHVADPEFTDPTVQQGSTTNGTLVASDITPTDFGGGDVQQYVRTVRAEFGSNAQISYIGEAGWLDAKLLVEALGKLGNTITRQHLLQILDGLPASSGGGFTAPLHFSSGAHDINRCLLLAKLENGHLSPYRDWACDTKNFD